mgnify:CR=1 FL=1|jgi:hypothetical protein
MDERNLWHLACDWVKFSKVREWKERFFWAIVPGVSVRVVWPKGPISLGFDSDGEEFIVDSADPNEHYRPWLEQHVGRQGIDWQWRIGEFGIWTDEADSLDIKFRLGKTKYATIAAMKWTQ